MMIDFAKELDLPPGDQEGCPGNASTGQFLIDGLELVPNGAEELKFPRDFHGKGGGRGLPAVFFCLCWKRACFYSWDFAAAAMAAGVSSGSGQSVRSRVGK